MVSGLRQQRNIDGTPDFEQLFGEQYGRLVQALFLLAGDAAEAEDLAQEALARAYERWDRVRFMESPVGYVYRTALNLNRRRVRRLLGLRERIPRERDESPSSAPDVETARDVRAALERIPSALREALVMHEWLGLRSEELGRILGIRPSSARARVHRARAAFKEAIGEDYG
jgi:RNA polymerase sigma factor (sigma-70 family)